MAHWHSFGLSPLRAVVHQCQQHLAKMLKQLQDEEVILCFLQRFDAHFLDSDTEVAEFGVGSEVSKIIGWTELTGSDGEKKAVLISALSLLSRSVEGA